MINYTERITRLMRDVVARTPRLSFIDLREILVFGRFGRADAEGAFATCHCLTLPESEPGYFFWRDRTTGELTRRSEWFVTKSPEVRLGRTKIKYLISFALPRFCNQRLDRSRKAELYPAGTDAWVAKLDTIVHELYHIDPDETGIRTVTRSDGSHSPRSHGPMFYENVAEMVQSYLASGADPSLYGFLREDFGALTVRHGGVVCTTFRNFPSFPQRYQEAVDMPADPLVKIEPVKAPTQPVLYTEGDLHVRHFTETGARRLVAGRHHQAA
jgi:hypothetical protein